MRACCYFTIYELLSQPPQHPAALAVWLQEAAGWRAHWWECHLRVGAQSGLDHCHVVTSIRKTDWHCGLSSSHSVHNHSLKNTCLPGLLFQLTRLNIHTQKTKAFATPHEVVAYCAQYTATGDAKSPGATAQRVKLCRACALTAVAVDHCTCHREGIWNRGKSWKKQMLKDIGHGSHVLPTGFLDLDSRAPQTKSFKLTRSFRMGSGFSSVECFHRIHHVLDSALLVLSPHWSFAMQIQQALGRAVSWLLNRLYKSFSLG